MDWKRLVKLMLPIRLRHGKRIQRLIGGLVGQTMTDAEIAERHKDAMIKTARMLGQKMVVEQVLRERYGDGIEIRGQEDGLVVIFGYETPAEDFVRLCPDVAAGSARAVLITDVAGTDVGCDFVVEVPPEVDTDEVRELVRGMVFAGVGFRVES